MADYTITEVENTIISALNPLKSEIGVKTIKTYGDELDSPEALKSAMVAQFPAIYVVYGRGEYSAHGERKIGKMPFSLFVCDRSLRNEEEARRGGSKNPGTYAILDAIKAKLWGKTLGLTIEPFELRSETPIWFGKGLSIYEAEYETSQALLYPK